MHPGPRFLTWVSEKTPSNGRKSLTCFKPLNAWHNLEGGRLLFKMGPHAGEALNLACGQCTGCRMDYAAGWTVRCVHEAQLHKANSWITLTYADEHLPEGGVLQPRDFTLFMKKFRAWRSQTHNDKYLYRMFCCGEYGNLCQNCGRPEKGPRQCQCVSMVPGFGRPHFHCVLFGYEFPDLEPYSVERGIQYFISEECNKLWGKGRATICGVTAANMAYTCRYALKKINGKRKKSHYKKIDRETGEMWIMKQEYTVMSRMPGIGAKWFDKFESDVYPADECVLVLPNGGNPKKPPGGDPLDAIKNQPQAKSQTKTKRYKTPKFYDKLYERKHGPEAMAIIKETRIEKAKEFFASPEAEPNRMYAKEKVLELNLRKLHRDYESGNLHETDARGDREVEMILAAAENYD